MRAGTSMTEVTGGTPMVQLSNVVPGGAADGFVKLDLSGDLYAIKRIDA